MEWVLLFATMFLLLPTELQQEVDNHSYLIIPVPARISSFGRTILRPFRSTASLLCHAVGQSTLRREWLRGDQILRGGSNLKIQIMDSGELLITDLQQSDSGNYTCQVGNSHGSDHIQYTVTVQGETLYEAHTPEISVWMPTG